VKRDEWTRLKILRIDGGVVDIVRDGAKKKVGGIGRIGF